MRKTIVLAEYFRMKELFETLNKSCPVCVASRNLEKRYLAKDEKNCMLLTNDVHGMTACHPTVQKRCRKIVEMKNEFEELLEEEIEIVDNILYDKYNLSFHETERLYRKWKESR